MFEPHSFLWHYLWIAPSVLLLLLAVVFYRRSLQRKLQVFLIFAVVEGVMSLALYAADLMPSVSGTLWWKATLVRLVIDVILKFALIGEIFSGVFKPYAAVSKLGRTMIRGVGAALVLAATLVAAIAPTDRHVVGLVSGAHLLELADFMIECGLLVFIYLFAAYFRLAWERLGLGIALGLGVSASVHLGTWALLANLPLNPHGRHLLDLLNMTSYHVCVVIWFYYVLTTPKATLMGQLSERSGTRHHHDENDDDGDGQARDDKAPSGEDERQKDLDVWNRELERLLRR
jgi:hypothetical protein